MCGIAGFYSKEIDYEKHGTYYKNILEQMHLLQKHRGPDEHGIHLSGCCGLAHARLSIIDLKNGRQPMCRQAGDCTYGIVYNGELYNTKELRDSLILRGCRFLTESDTEVILTGFMEYGPEFVKRMNGIFAFAISDPAHKKLYLFRDRCGVKPLFYTYLGSELIFSSEIKGLFAHPDIHPRLDRRGLNEIFSIGPAKTYGTGVFHNIEELLPGHYMVCTPEGFFQTCYWKLSSHPHQDNYETTVEKTTELIYDSIRRQMVSDVPICTFLSGGIDSSLVSSICAGELKKQGKQLDTFSFDFVDNDKNFKASSFQPSQDRPYVEMMVRYLDSNHHYLECSSLKQAELLNASVDAHDLPAMADVDSSMLYFCSIVKNYNKVVLTGECADEIFGGYPWFHKKECFESQTFPWTIDLAPRKIMLRDDFLDFLKMDDYVKEAYTRSVSETPLCSSDTPEEARRREIAYLNLKWFMQTLLTRMDRTSMYSGLEARVPFADHRIIEYIWNVPWDMKTKNGVVKSLLREAGKNWLPEEIMYRKKSPYPKTYDKNYESLLAGRLREVIEDSSSPVMRFLDKEKVLAFLKSPSDYGKPWYGQLMAGPQMMAYMLQVNEWMRKYRIEVLDR